MKLSLSAQETPLFKVYSDDYLFNIPSVQRPYSWTTAEAGELLDDLLDFIDHYNITEQNINNVDEPYFLGSIVLVKGEEPRSDVLDGQQRITTLTILLAVLRDYLSKDYSDDIESMIVQRGNKILGTADTYRLCLRARDNDFFNKNIQSQGSTHRLNEQLPVKTDSQKLIRDNALYLIERLNDLEEEIVKVLPTVIATLCYVVIVSTPNFESAFRIFTVLNDRGLDLMNSDIFKARVIGDITEKDQDYYTAKWEDVETRLGRERFNKLFEHIRMIIQKRKGSANIKDEYDKIFSNISGKEFINEVLLPYSDIYLQLVEYRSFHINQPELLKVLSLLNRIDNNDWIPVAMYYFKHYNKDLLRFLERLEILAGTSMVLRKNFNWRMSRYSQVLREFESVEKDPDLQSNSSSLTVTHEDKKLVLEKLNGDVYTDLKNTARRYVLLRLDSLLTNGQPYYDHSLITVEHILPQNPNKNSEWLKHFKEPIQHVHRLGNLVLLTRAKNAQAKNYDFQKKKSSYFQSRKGVTSFALTTQIMQIAEWTPEAFKLRQEKLIDLLTEAWELDINNTENRE